MRNTLKLNIFASTSHGRWRVRPFFMGNERDSLHWDGPLPLSGEGGEAQANPGEGGQLSHCRDSER